MPALSQCPAPDADVWSRRCLAVVAVATVFLIGGLMLLWLKAPQILILSPDSNGYLDQSVSALSGHGFSYGHARGFVYPLFVYGAIEAFGSLSGLVSLQNLGFVLMLAMLLSLLWIDIVPMRQAGRRILVRTVAVATAAFWLTLAFFSYAPTAITTHALGPELVYSFLAVTAAVTLIYAFRVRSDRSFGFAILMCVSVFSSWANVLVKPQWLLAAVFLTGVWLCVLLASALSKPNKLLIAGGMSALVAISLVVPEHRLQTKYDPWGPVFGVKTLFCNHSDIIVRAAVERPDLWAGLPDDFVQSLMKILRSEMDGVNGWPLRGFNGDKCMYNDEPGKLISDYYKGDIDDIYAFYGSTFTRAIRVEPGLYLRKILIQMMDAASHPFHNSDLVVTSDDRAAREIIAGHPDLAWLFTSPLTGKVESVMARYLPRIGQPLARRLERSSYGVLIFIGGTWLAFLALFRLSDFRVSSTALFAIAVLTGAWLAQSLTVAVSHTFDVGRYHWVGAPLMLGALFLSFNLVAQAILYWLVCPLDRALRRKPQ